jgi:hypothetical protein
MELGIDFLGSKYTLDCQGEEENELLCQIAKELARKTMRGKLTAC